MAWHLAQLHENSASWQPHINTVQLTLQKETERMKIANHGVMSV